jgi:hypothetical protein
MSAAHVFAPYIVWIFWGVVIGLLAKRKNLNPWGWGLLGGLFWPVGLIALAFQKFRCTVCGSSIDGKPAKSKLCGDCAAEG